MNVPQWQTEAAKSAYDAYKAYTGGKSAVTGDPLPEFHQLPAKIYNAWHAASLAAVKVSDLTR